MNSPVFLAKRAATANSFILGIELTADSDNMTTEIKITLVRGNPRLQDLFERHRKLPFRGDAEKCV